MVKQVRTFSNRFMKLLRFLALTSILYNIWNRLQINIKKLEYSSLGNFNIVEGDVLTHKLMKAVVRDALFIAVSLSTRDCTVTSYNTLHKNHVLLLR